MNKNHMRNVMHRLLIALECCILASLVLSFVAGKLPSRRKFVTTSASEFRVGIANADELKEAISYGQVYFQTNEWRVSKAEHAVSFNGAALSNGMIRTVSPYPTRGLTLYLNFKPGKYDPELIKFTDARLNDMPIDLTDTKWGNSQVGFVAYAYTPECWCNGYWKEVLGFVVVIGLCSFMLSGCLIKRVTA